MDNSKGRNTMSEDDSDYTPHHRASKTREVRRRQRPRTQHRERAASSSVFSSVFSIWRYLAQVSSITLYILKWPIAIALCALIGLHAWRYMFGMTTGIIFSRTHGLCALPNWMVGTFPVCTVVPTAHPYFEKVIETDRDVAAIQRIGADSVALPYRVQVGQSKVKRMIIQLSAIDTPRKETLVGFLKEVNTLVADAVGDMQTSQIKADGLVNSVILTNSWAAKELRSIEARDNSWGAPLYNLGGAIGGAIGVTKPHTTEKEVQNVFMDHTNRLVNKAELVVASFLKSSQSLIALQDLLELLAVEFGVESETVAGLKISQQSYWKIVLASYRHKMADFDKATKLCAEFSEELIKASSVTQSALYQTMQIRSKVIEVQDELAGAAEGLTIGQNGTVSSFQLTIAKLGASVEYLETEKRESMALKKKRIAAMEEELKKRKPIVIPVT